VANKNHIRLLRKGWSVWNNGRIKKHILNPDFRDGDLNKSDLSFVDLSGADLQGAILFETTCLGVDFSRADLAGAILIRANLHGAEFRYANLNGANLHGADLIEAKLIGTSLDKANLTESTFGWTAIDGIDFSKTNGLETIKHIGPSYIDIQTIFKSKGMIPKIFLRGSGVPEQAINFMDSPVSKKNEFYSCFISYSVKDQPFSERLHADLQNNGIRCWFASNDMKIGDKIRQIIDDAIRSHDKLLLVISKHSINSQWVEKEVETAFEEERKRKRTILFPIRLDSAVMDTNQSWAADIRRTRHIGDFTGWENSLSYQKSFDQLVQNLRGEDISTL